MQAGTRQMPAALLRLAIHALSGCEEMKIFTCPTCNGALYFDNLTCACGTSVSFDPEAEAFEQLDVPCANREQIDCNWHAEAGPGTYCRACAMTEIVPDSLVTTNIPLWADTEAAKRWVIDNLAAGTGFARKTRARRRCFICWQKAVRRYPWDTWGAW